jgi:hypothetical protein
MKVRFGEWGINRGAPKKPGVSPNGEQERIGMGLYGQIKGHVVAHHRKIGGQCRRSFLSVPGRCVDVNAVLPIHAASEVRINGRDFLLASATAAFFNDEVATQREGDSVFVSQSFHTSIAAAINALSETGVTL